MYFQSVFINTFVVIANMATKWQAIAVFFVALPVGGINLVHT